MIGYSRFRGSSTLIDELDDVDTSTVSVNDILRWDGSNWVPEDNPTLAGGTFNGTVKITRLLVGGVQG